MKKGRLLGLGILGLLFTTSVQAESFDWSDVDWNQKYTTITTQKVPIYKDFDSLEVIGNTSHYKNKTLRINATYRLKNGKVYHEISGPDYQKMGFIDASQVKTTNSEWGLKMKAENQYATIIQKSQSIWADLNWGWKANSDDYYKRTLKIDGCYNKFADKNYYALYEPKQFLGYLTSAAVAVSDSPLGKAFSTNTTLKIDNANASLYKDKNLAKKTSAKPFYNKEVTAKYYYNHYNKKTYYSIYNKDNKWLGYIDKNDTTKYASPDKAWGKKKSYHRYVTVMSKNYSFYSNKEWKKKGSSSRYYHQTLKTNGYYNHKNGNRYYSVYDKNNRWLGYINANSMKATVEPFGALIKENNRYLSIKNGNYWIYRNKEWQRKTKTKSYSKQTLKANGYYRHFNGSIYYSIREKKRWIGYVNKNALNLHDTGYGKCYNYSRYYSVTSKNYSRYSNQLGDKKGTTSSYYKKTIKIKRYYNHYNGSRYYSIYDKDNRWLGYVNANAGKVTKSSWGIKHSYKKTATIQRKNYSIYRNQSWDKKTSTSRYYKKKMKIDGYYNHYNGSRYDSVRYGNRWMGYVNHGAFTVNMKAIHSSGVYQYVYNAARDVVKRYGGVITSGYRPGSRNELGEYDDHSRRCAIDISGVNYSTYQKMKYYVVKKYKNAKLKYTIANNTWATHSGGWRWTTYPYGAHMDHIHISFYKP